MTYCCQEGTKLHLEHQRKSSSFLRIAILFASDKFIYISCYVIKLIKSLFNLKFQHECYCSAGEQSLSPVSYVRYASDIEQLYGHWVSKYVQ